MDPVNEAINKAGLTLEEIDQVEILGGGVRVPQVTKLLEQGLNGKKLNVHLNGDEAMCFGSAFIGSNSSSSFRVGKVLMTQKPDYDIKLLISPLRADTVITTREEQAAEGVEEADMVDYKQDLLLFNRTGDYMGKTKAMTMAYDVDMKLELFRVDENGEELLDTFELDDLKKMYQQEIEARQKSAEDKKKKKNASKNKTESNETESAEETPAPTTDEEGVVTIEKPKLKFAIEFSRSGLLRMTRANMGSMYINYKKVPKTIQLNKEQKAAARKRLAFY